MCVYVFVCVCVCVCGGRAGGGGSTIIGGVNICLFYVSFFLLQWNIYLETTQMILVLRVYLLEFNICRVTVLLPVDFCVHFMIFNICWCYWQLLLLPFAALLLLHLIFTSPYLLLDGTYFKIPCVTTTGGVWWLKEGMKLFYNFCNMGSHYKIL